jgi:hypothetical protein
VPGVTPRELGPTVVRTLVAALPGTEERAHHGHPDFRVGGRIFATLWPDQDRAVLRLDAGEAFAVAAAHPGACRVVSDHPSIAWLSVALDGLGRDAFAALLEEAWVLRAPAALAAAYAESASRSAAASSTGGRQARSVQT